MVRPFETYFLSFWVLVLSAALAACGSPEQSDQTPGASGTDTTTASSAEVSRQASPSGSAQPPLDHEAVPDDITVPDGMVYVPGGHTRIGIDAGELYELRAKQPPGARHLFGPASTPAFDTTITAFFLDIHPVTVAQFQRFVEATEFTTQAEEFGNAGVLDTQLGQWRLVDGATWRRPQGLDEPAAEDDHPVTQVSWNDAEAYCEWAEKRLPTEFEWEHAARGTRDRDSFCTWGRCGEEARLQKANTWQGRFPLRNTAEDGYRYTSPVGAFGETELGLQDMSGNVWEWTESWFRLYGERDVPFEPSSDSEKVQRGGSFICDDCGGYYLFARSRTTPETSLFHVGFRCAKDVPHQ